MDESKIIDEYILTGSSDIADKIAQNINNFIGNKKFLKINLALLLNVIERCYDISLETASIFIDNILHYQDISPDKLIRHFNIDKNKKKNISWINESISSLSLKTWYENAKDIAIITNEQAKYHIDNDINSKVALYLGGDITNIKVDAIVNPLNENFKCLNSLNEAIFSRAGVEMLVECFASKNCHVGTCYVTSGYSLPAKYCIHSIGSSDESLEQLENRYNNILNRIDGDLIRSIALCHISYGNESYHVQGTIRVALNTVRSYLDVKKNSDKIDRIVFVIFERHICNIYSRLTPIYFPFSMQS